MSKREMSDYAIYLGEGVWWQLSKADVATGKYKDFPLKLRPLGRERWI